MIDKPLHLFKTFSSELDPVRLQHKFLHALLKLQNVDRGSIWIKKDQAYVCIEAAGAQSEKIKGAAIDTSHPSIVGWVIENGKMTISDPTEDPRHYRELEENIAIKSSLILCFPLFLRSDQVYGAVQIIDITPGKTRLNLDQAHLKNIQDLINIGSIALSNAILYDAQRKETQTLRQALEQIRREDLLIGQSAVFLDCMERIKNYAATDYPVLITGESGTGKELVARNIHQLSRRADKPLLVQNCSAIPETLLESELFGYKQGAFSGATKDKTGLFEAADGGTVFLDEIGDMPLNLQARILRVIQNAEIKPLGETRTKKIDVKIISATNHDMNALVEKGLFRSDLFYRLSVLPLHVPGLRERKMDIPLLLRHFIKKEAVRIGVSQKTVSAGAMECLMAYAWPGNIRELENLVRYLLVVNDSAEIRAADLPSHFTGQTDMTAPVDTDEPVTGSRTAPSSIETAFAEKTWLEVEIAFARYLLMRNNWNISQAASEAGLNRSTFVSRLRRLGLQRPGAGGVQSKAALP